MSLEKCKRGITTYASLIANKERTTSLSKEGKGAAQNFSSAVKVANTFNLRLC